MGTMIYSNGTLSLNQIKKILDDKNCALYFEQKAKRPEGWDWTKHGFFHGPKTEITSISEAVEYIEKELNGEGSLCYELLDSYFESVPHAYETYESESPFVWMYNDSKYVYKIVESVYLLGYTPEHPSLSLEVSKVGIGEACISIGTWERDADDGYEFHSVGSRIFEHIPEDVLSNVWAGLKKADAFLEKRFKKEID